METPTARAPTDPSRRRSRAVRRHHLRPRGTSAKTAWTASTSFDGSASACLRFNAGPMLSRARRNSPATTSRSASPTCTSGRVVRLPRMSASTGARIAMSSARVCSRCGIKDPAFQPSSTRTTSTCRAPRMARWLVLGPHLRLVSGRITILRSDGASRGARIRDRKAMPRSARRNATVRDQEPRVHTRGFGFWPSTPNSPRAA